MNKKLIILIGVGVVVLCCIGAVLLLLLTGAGTIIQQSVKDPENVNITVDVPLQVTQDEGVIIEIRIENTASEAQLLHSVDIASSYLEGIAIEEAQPAFHDDYPLQIVNMHTYTFEKKIPPGEMLVVQLMGTVLGSGDYSGSIDVCINTGSLCKTFMTRTVVEE